MAAVRFSEMSFLGQCDFETSFQHFLNTLGREGGGHKKRVLSVRS